MILPIFCLPNFLPQLANFFARMYSSYSWLSASLHLHFIILLCLQILSFFPPTFSFSLSLSFAQAASGNVQCYWIFQALRLLPLILFKLQPLLWTAKKHTLGPTPHCYNKNVNKINTRCFICTKSTESETFKWKQKQEAFPSLLTPLKQCSYKGSEIYSSIHPIPSNHTFRFECFKLFFIKLCWPKMV